MADFNTGLFAGLERKQLSERMPREPIVQVKREFIAKLGRYAGLHLTPAREAGEHDHSLVAPRPGHDDEPFQPEPEPIVQAKQCVPNAMGREAKDEGSSSAAVTVSGPVAIGRPALTLKSQS